MSDTSQNETETIDRPRLSITNLRTTFTTDQETIRAVDGVSFGVSPQQTLGVVGESGSGKSVTARSILGLVDDPGEVHPDSEIRYHDPAFVEEVARTYPDRVKRADREETERHTDSFVTVNAGSGDGKSVTVERGSVDLVGAPDSVVKSVRGSEIAMVFQDALGSLNPVYTVGNQIKELLDIHQGVTGATATERATELLESVGIPDPKRRLDEYPHQFSGGMQQRAVIALALACDPSVLLCDEPTTALDVTIQAQILELLDRLQRERGLSIVFITHDMGVIAQVADSVAVMYAGEVVERASVDRLFDQPKHPYTKGLLQSIPGLTGEVDRLPTIDGSVPTPNEQATYCRYAPRCPEAFEECDSIHPEHVPVEDGIKDGPDVDHTAACLLYPESADLGDRLRQHRASDDTTTENTRGSRQ
ncbi:ABC transporter ATP-binding protein [Halovenus rubra]|uniref:Nickel import system ATP-binding protein NikD n=2 Tax=Halovenus rubra TaxID=869890 RepID=A0ABD5XCP1_9EURY|nr:ABC transporter ATP-binding protein [Halovenus rubra]